jgi:hypothetical protein
MMHPIRSCCLCTSLSVVILTAGVGPVAAQTASPPPIHGVPGVENFLSDIVTDFKHLASKEAVSWLTLGLAGALMVHALDEPSSITMSRSIGAERMFAPGERMGAAKYQFAGALATYGVGRFTGNSRIADFGSDLVRANIVAQVMTTGIKMAVQRSRPDGTQYSFPSGHTSVSFAAATVVQRHFGWSAGVPAYAAASYIAASRIQERRHYLSDVAFGAVVGIVSGRAVTVGHGDHRFAVEPMMPASGGVGIAFVKK